MAEIDHSHISFSPFPIDQLELIQEFIPPSVICFTTIREAWNTQKLKALEDHGYAVTVLYEDLSKLMSGTEIRAKIRCNDDSWKDLVPLGVPEFLEESGIIPRI